MADATGAGEPMIDGDKKDRNQGVTFTNRTGPAGACLTCLSSTPGWCRKNLLLVLTIVGVIFGIIIGFSLRPANISAEAIMLVSFPGEMLMSMLKMLIVPLIISSMITGLASLDPKNSGRMGARAIVYYLLTTLVAIILGIILVLAIHPGDRDDGVQNGAKRKKLLPALWMLSWIYLELNSTMANSFTTVLTTTQRTILDASYTDSNNTVVVIREEVTKWVRTYPMNDGVNVLGIITFCTAFGILISNMGARGKIMIDFFSVLNEIIMKMVIIVMWYSPIGIMFLIAGKILELDDPEKVGKQLGMYMVTILMGLSIHALILLPGIYFVLTRKNPFHLMWGVVQALVTAIGTASSTATLPVTFQCLEDKLHIDKRVTRFVLPIGATINMDGTALYEAVAPIFIAQMNGMELTFGKIIAISLTATCASIGAAAIPSAGLVTMVMVLTSVGLPADDISLILAVDWFLDRFRTATNVLGDSFGAAVVAHLSRHELEQDHHVPIDDTIEFDSHENGKRKSITNSTKGGIIEDQL